MRRICAPGFAVLLVAAGATIFAASQHPAAEPAGPLSARARATNPPGGPQPPTLLRVDSSLVLIPVHVTTAAGGTVTGLSRDAFQLFEDDAEQTIASFFTEDAPVSVGIVFDSSGSMRPKIHKSAEAAASFFRTSNPEDEFFLIEFADRARVVVPFTTESGEIFNQIARTHPMGRTSLIDAIFLGCAQMKRARHARKALVIFSDGGDNWSRHSLAEVRDLLLESDIQVYAMGIFDFDYMRNHSIEERNGPALLDELTSLTGGRHFPVDELDQLPEISERIGRELHSQYLLGYYSTNTARDGKYRHVKVALRSPNATELHISYRTGYYGPAQ